MHWAAHNNSQISTQWLIAKQIEIGFGFSLLVACDADLCFLCVLVRQTVSVVLRCIGRAHVTTC